MASEFVDVKQVEDGEFKNSEDDGNISLGDLGDVMAALNTSEDAAAATSPLTPSDGDEGIESSIKDLGDFGQDLWEYLAKEKLRLNGQKPTLNVDSLSITEMTDVVKAISKPGKSKKAKYKKKERRRKKAITLLRRGTTSDTGPGSDSEGETEGGHTMDEHVDTSFQESSSPGNEIAKLWQERTIRVHFDSLPSKSLFAIEPSKYLTRQKKTPLQRSRDVTKKMIQHFKDYASNGVVFDETTSKSTLASNQKSTSDSIHVFIDNSNILVGMLGTISDRDGIDIYEIPRYSRPKLDYHVLFTILERGRRAERKVLVASSPLWQPLRDAEKAGYDVAVLQRVTKSLQIGLDSTSEEEASTKRRAKKEQGVDELLHLKILESILDYEKPTTMVLATGDAAPSEYGEGFFKCAQRALERGWKVEVISWRRGVSKLWTDKEFKRQWKGQFRVICCLEEFLEELEA